MSLEKHGVVVHCEYCKHIASDGCGGFDVTVPVQASDAAGTARLRCIVSPEGHRAELVEWRSESGGKEPTEEVRQRVSDVIDFVAEQRICGHHRICPVEVIRLVEQHGSRAP